MMQENNYRKLFPMIGLSFASLYVLMYSMIDTFDNVYASINQVYMAGLMTAPMYRTAPDARHVPRQERPQELPIGYSGLLPNEYMNSKTPARMLAAKITVLLSCSCGR